MNLGKIQPWALASAILALVAGGCSSSTPALQTVPAGAPTGATGDWNDVDAAVDTGASQSEMAVVERQELGPDVYLYTLITATDEPVTLRIERPRTGAAPDEIRMTCVVGRFGDAAKEASLTSRVRKRLHDLHGKDYAPIR